MRRSLLLALFALTGCGTSRAPGVGGLTCVPYARDRSGLAIRGDAWQWWGAASGRYQRNRTPRSGSVLVFMRTSRLPLGHVSVVARVVSPREIRVDHANWGSGTGKGRIARNQPVMDVSPTNDWSLVRVWYARIGSYGATTYPAHGFIHNRLVTAAG
jgi:surface antigen